MDWRPITGCSPISTGCANCVGMRSFAAPKDLVIPSKTGPVWNGKLRFHADRLGEPAKLDRPTSINVCANGDLFHEKAPDVWIDAVFDAIERAPRHTYVILTKRARRMREYLTERFPFGVPENIQIGVSAERQQEADSRITDLLETPAATRFVFFYPLLGPINAAPFFEAGKIAYALAGEELHRPAQPIWLLGLSATAARYGVPFTIRSDVIPH